MLKLKRASYWLASLSLALTPLLIAAVAFAASATVYLSPASSSATNGSTFTVGLRVNSGSEPVSAAEVNLSYPTDKMDFVGISNSSSWGFEIVSSGGSGNVRIDRGANPPVSGDTQIASIRFKAKVSSGSGTINVSSARVISQNSETDIPVSTKGSTYSFQAPAPAAQADTVAPTISKKPEVSEITKNSAVVTWSTSEPSTSEVVYGPDSNYGLAAADTALVTEHKVTLSSPLITAGNTYHYVVKSIDPAGNAVSSDEATFTTDGYDLDVKVLNQRNRAVSGAKVTIDERVGTTNKSGQVTINDLPLGILAGTVEYKGKKTTVSVTMVEPAQEGIKQSATFKIETPKPVGLVITAVVAALAVATFVGWHYLKQRRGGGGPSKSAGSTGTGPSPDGGLSSSPPSTVINPTTGN